MFRHLYLFALTAASLLAADDAAAFCTILPHYRYVGDKVHDSKCTDDTIQSAIDNSTCPNTTIVITQENISNATYPAQALDIYNKSVILAGVAAGVPCNYQPGTCDPSVGCGGGGGGGSPVVTLSGSGNGNVSVIHVHGNSNVTLQSLQLTGGSGTDEGLGITYGGAINFTGTGSLTLVNSEVVQNGAIYGGGISLAGSGGNATLTLGADTIIEQNTAVLDGGGIFLGASSHLLALAPRTFIGYNHAPNGRGGGIALFGPVPAQADIGSPGYNGAPVIEYNDAVYGGGIALLAQGPQNMGYIALARFFTTDPHNPVAVSNNTATVGGGGIYIQAGWDNAVPAQIGAAICAANFRMDNNVAPDGSAIYSDSHYAGVVLTHGGDVDLNPDNGCDYDNFSLTLDALGAATSCAPGVACNTINDNAAVDSGNQPTGATILINPAASMNANRFLMRFNTGTQAIHLASSYAVDIRDCLLADNTLSGELVRAENSPFDIDACTLANNTLGGPSVIYSSNKAYPNEYSFLQDSIVDQPGLVTLIYGDKSLVDTNYVLSNDISTIPYAKQGEPTFVDAAAGDYHLTPGSLGVDYAPYESNGFTTTPIFDLDGRPRSFDVPQIPNVQGPRDLGAYELAPSCYNIDTVFCAGFEGIGN